MTQPQERTTSEVLKEAYGEEMLLVDDTGKEVLHRVIVEWTVNGTVFAVLAEEGAEDPDEWIYAKASRSEDGEWELDSIYDEDEWDQVDEWLDEWLFEQQSK